MGLVYPLERGTPGGEVIIKGEVLNYSALPPVAAHVLEVYLVEEKQGTWLLGTRRPAGLYRSNGATWVYLGINIDQVSTAEMAAGTETDVRIFSPENVHTMIEEHAGLHSGTVVKTSSYTMLPSDYTILMDATNNTVIITLEAVPDHGRIVNLKCINDTFACFVNPNGKTIDGSGSNLGVVAPNSITLQYDSAFGWALI